MVGLKVIILQVGFAGLNTPAPAILPTDQIEPEEEATLIYNLLLNYVKIFFKKGRKEKKH